LSWNAVGGRDTVALTELQSDSYNIFWLQHTRSLCDADVIPIGESQRGSVLLGQLLMCVGKQHKVSGLPPHAHHRVHCLVCNVWDKG
jgi:hypothetical protein